MSRNKQNKQQQKGGQGKVEQASKVVEQAPKADDAEVGKENTKVEEASKVVEETPKAKVVEEVKSVFPTSPGDAEQTKLNLVKESDLDKIKKLATTSLLVSQFDRILEIGEDTPIENVAVKQSFLKTMRATLSNDDISQGDVDFISYIMTHVPETQPIKLLTGCENKDLMDTIIFFDGVLAGVKPTIEPPFSSHAVSKIRKI